MGFRFSTVIFVVWKKQFFYAWYFTQHSTVKTTPDIIAISQSKINENVSANLNIPGYAFLNNNWKTQAGDVGLYLSNDLKFLRGSHLDISHDRIESCWIELERTAQKIL